MRGRSRPLSLALSLGALLLMPAAQAVTFTVNSPADFIDGNPGDGICATGGICDGVPCCTLRAAVMEANRTSGAVIVLPAGTWNLTIPPSGTDDETTGDLNLGADMTITGAGAAVTIIEASGLGDRVFDVTAGHTVVLSGVTIQNAEETASDGGGIRSSGHLTVRDSRILNCKAGFSGGGIAAERVTSALTIEGTTIDHCEAGFGGGVACKYTTLSISSSTFSGNTATYRGGAILGFGSTLTIVGSTISGNSAHDYGGGISLDYDALASAELNLVNCTVSGNYSREDGGGILNGANNTTRLFSSTVTENQADSDFDGSGTGGGVYNAGTVTFLNTIFANNTETYQVGNVYVPTIGECAGTIASQGNSILANYDTSHCTVTGSFVLADPVLGPLQANGGRTQTHALLPGSPAIDGGSPSGCTGLLGAPLTVDQRGVHRALGAAFDIGAYESGSPKGDVNGDGQVNVADIFALINYLFAGGAFPPGLANVDGNGVIDVADVFYLINYLFAGGPAPA
jgi:CSLREA domain-containing protein